MPDTYHALGLHMHQPPGNLKLLIEKANWDANQIMLCYERPLKYLRQYHDVARLHVGFSGILLEQFRNPEIVQRYASIVDIPRMIHDYAAADNLELIGMGYYHPIFPLIPTDDWHEQLHRGREIMTELFGRAPKGFWPPEMAFAMEMVPYLVDAGYEYVVVDSVHVKPIEGPTTQCTPFKPYLAEYGGKQITVIPRNRDISNAQESGMDAGWFESEVRNKVSGCPPPRLVTTWSDGENGGWFRQTSEPSGFWGHFYAPFMEKVRGGSIQPVLLSEYIREHPPQEKVWVQTGAWNVGSTSGYDFAQWAGSETQRRAIAEIVEVSRIYHEASASLQRQTQIGLADPEAERLLREARELVLQAETSCYLFWGDAWVNRVYEVTIPARDLLAKARQRIQS